jgi:hypothetical protein
MAPAPADGRECGFGVAARLVKAGEQQIRVLVRRTAEHAGPEQEGFQLPGRGRLRGGIGVDGEHGSEHQRAQPVAG